MHHDSMDRHNLLMETSSRHLIQVLIGWEVHDGTVRTTSNRSNFTELPAD